MRSIMNPRSAILEPIAHGVYRRGAGTQIIGSMAKFRGRIDVPVGAHTDHRHVALPVGE